MPKLPVEFVSYEGSKHSNLTLLQLQQQQFQQQM